MRQRLPAPPARPSIVFEGSRHPSSQPASSLDRHRGNYLLLRVIPSSSKSARTVPPPRLTVGEPLVETAGGGQDHHRPPVGKSRVDEPGFDTGGLFDQDYLHVYGRVDRLGLHRLWLLAVAIPTRSAPARALPPMGLRPYRQVDR